MGTADEASMFSLVTKADKENDGLQPPLIACVFTPLFIPSVRGFPLGKRKRKRLSGVTGSYPYLEFRSKPLMTVTIRLD